MLFGQPGVGKTTFISSVTEIPEMSPVLIVDFDDKAKKSLKYTKYDKKGMYVIKGFDLPGKKIKVRALMDKIILQLKTDTFFNTVAIDTGSELMSMLLMEIVSEPSRGGVSKSITDKPTQSDYQQCITIFNQYMRELVALNKHVIVTFHTKPEFVTDDRGQETFKGYVPAIIGKAAPDQICAKFMLVGALTKQMRNGKIEYKLHCQAHPEYKKLRTEIPKLNVIDNPTMKKIMEAMNETENA